MAGTVADYIALLDGPIDLKIGGDIDKDFNFSIPATAAVTQHSILSLLVHSMGAANALKANISINNVKVWTYGPTNSNLTCSFHEVVSPNENAGGPVLKTGSNKLTVKVESGTGTFRFSDMVVWFQNNV